MDRVDLGRIHVMPKGDYSALAKYEPLDLVRYNGAAYIVRREVSGVTPVDGADYMKVVQDGTDGAQGPKGATGDPGKDGATGPAGPGVPTGGTAGQVLTKKSSTNYDTQWSTPASSGGGVGQSMAGKTVKPTSTTSVVAGDGAEIFNDYRTRTFDSDGASAGNIASGAYSHSEGECTSSSGKRSHAEGSWTNSNGNSSHAEGQSTLAAGDMSHAEGWGCNATDDGAHAEGLFTVASGFGSHAEGQNTTASGEVAHAEGIPSYLTSDNSLVHEGPEASGMGSHAEGCGTIAKGQGSHAEGYWTQANEGASHAGGMYTVAQALGQFVTGIANVTYSTVSNRFIVGKGTGNSTGTGTLTKANCFRVTDTGVYATGAHNTSGADYAEMFEWVDGNPQKKDRCGRFATLDGAKIRLAGPDDDYIIGIVSGNPSVLGDVHDDQWQGMFLYDVFGRPLWEDVETTLLGSKNSEAPSTYIEHRQKLNPDYDDSQPYQPRSERPEWDAVGMLGKLVAVDDGSCKVNGWCTAGGGGVATHSENRTKYRVMERLDENHIRVLIL